MFIHHFLIAVVSTAIVSPMLGGLLGLVRLSSDFSVDAFWPSTGESNEIALQVATSNDEALTWQEPAWNLMSTPAILENSISKKPVDPWERFRNFDCNDSNGVCCKGNPLASHRPRTTL